MSGLENIVALVGTGMDADEVFEWGMLLSLAIPFVFILSTLAWIQKRKKFLLPWVSIFLSMEIIIFMSAFNLTQSLSDCHISEIPTTLVLSKDPWFSNNMADTEVSKSIAVEQEYCRSRLLGHSDWSDWKFDKTFLKEDKHE